MSRLIYSLLLFVASLSMHAFDFDGIDLNKPYIDVTREIAKRGYHYDNDRNCLKGNCQGTEIYLSINYVDVSKMGRVGQLIVEIPMPNNEQVLHDVTTIFNVVYHQVSKTDNSITYQADKDGTQLVVSRRGSSIFLTYNTPYYKPRN